MRDHLRYLKIVLRHRWFVFIAGLKTGAPLWRLIIHDLSKFSRAEWGPYMRRFVKGRGGTFNTIKDPDEWHLAWTHHWHRNPHHWEHWMVIDQGGIKAMRPVDMPDKFIKEMVADWCAAGKAYTGNWDIVPWYELHRDRIRLTVATRRKVEDLLYRMDVLLHGSP